MFEMYGDTLSVYDVAEALGCGKNRVYELLSDNSLKGFRLGHVWRINREDLEAFCRNASGGTKK